LASSILTLAPSWSTAVCCAAACSNKRAAHGKAASDTPGAFKVNARVSVYDVDDEESVVEQLSTDDVCFGDRPAGVLIAHVHTRTCVGLDWLAPRQRLSCQVVLATCHRQLSTPQPLICALLQRVVYQPMGGNPSCSAGAVWQLGVYHSPGNDIRDARTCMVRARPAIWR
jgi:hypothetical protein